ncbi:MAG TPA: FtsQ-type POTRA domain-containing protein [Candidatus Dormibacteraeota bacterium]|nr:FtsQ-type POTRA domain-containing protein [Candidatus Dormibacteraeota bacterium]
MRFRKRSSRFPAINWGERIDRAEPLKGQLWTRSEKALKEPDVHWSRRAAAGAVAILAAALLGWLAFGPAFAIHDILVSGAQHLTPQQVLSASGIDANGSMLSVDPITAQQRLLRQTWIRAAKVQPSLDGTLVLSISEWQPVAAYHAGPTGAVFLLSDQAVVLGPAQSPKGLTNIQGPAGADPRPGDHALDAQLLVALVNIQRGLPGLIGQSVASFIVDSCGNLTLVSTRGWKVYFGRVLTPEEFDSLRDKLAALKAIAGRVNYNSGDLLYINVMNPAEPAAGYKPKAAPTPSPSPGAHPSPSPSPSPSPTCR